MTVQNPHMSVHIGAMRLVGGQSGVGSHDAAQTLTLEDFPDPKLARALSPNGRAFWATQRRASAQVHACVKAYCDAQRIRPVDGPVRVTFRYTRPTRQRVDLDNLTTGVSKAVLDGLVRAGILTDDSSEHVVAVTAEAAYLRGVRQLDVTLTPAPAPGAAGGGGANDG